MTTREHKAREFVAADLYEALGLLRSAAELRPETGLDDTALPQLRADLNAAAKATTAVNDAFRAATQTGGA